MYDTAKNVIKCGTLRHKKSKVPLMFWKTPNHRNMRIHMDLVGPLTPSHGYKYILTITDAFTLELVSKELNHFGAIADLFRQIGGHSSRFVLFCSF